MAIRKAKPVARPTTARAIRDLQERVTSLERVIYARAKATLIKPKGIRR